MHPRLAGWAAVLCGLTVAVPAVEDPDEGGGHPDGCGEDDGEREEEGALTAGDALFCAAGRVG